MTNDCRVLALFRGGADTYDIAREMMIKESEAYAWLHVVLTKNREFRQAVKEGLAWPNSAPPPPTARA